MKKKKAQSFTLTIKPEVIQLFNEIQWLKTYVIDKQRQTRGDILHEALSDLAVKINHAKLIKTHSEEMEKSGIAPDVGRKSIKG